MKYYLVVGEASGDLHAANLMKEILKLDNQATFRFWGGDKMLAVGGHNVLHYKKRAYMGFLEVVKHLGSITQYLKQCKADIKQWQPDVVILVDYPGFNLRIAEFVKSIQIKVVYYISPQIWAWKEGRVKLIKRFVDLMIVILPFEKPFYQKHQYHVEYVGHPLLDEIKALSLNEDLPTQYPFLVDKPIIALLPGSRQQEIRSMLPLMLSARQHFPNYEWVVLGAPGLNEKAYRNACPNVDFKLIFGQTYQVLMRAEAALVTSGTATLETALLDVPEVVCYKSSRISYAIAKRLIKVKYISLVNLIMDQELVTELIQNQLTTKNLQTELKSILIGGLRRRKMKDGYQELRTKLGQSGASERAARLVVESLKK